MQCVGSILRGNIIAHLGGRYWMKSRVVDMPVVGNDVAKGKASIGKVNQYKPNQY